MKIAFVGKYPEGEIISGPEKVAKNLFSHIASLNPDSQFITYFHKQKSKRTFSQILFGSEKLSLDPLVIRLGILKIITELIKKKIELVHIITFERFGFIILLLKPILRFKLVYTIHGIYRFEENIFYRKPGLISRIKDQLLEKLIFTLSDKLFFLSPQMVELARKYYKLSFNRISIIPNGVSVKNLQSSSNFLFADVLEIVFYNGMDISRRRGFEELIRILSEADLQNIHLSVLGNLVKTNFKKVSFHNPIPENKLYEFLAGKHIFVDNLNYMPFSILALEAMALGLILIVSDKSGLSEYIKNGENGFVYDSKNPEKIVYTIEEITKRKFQLEVMSKNAVKTAELLSWKKISARYYNQYKIVKN